MTVFLGICESSVNGTSRPWACTRTTPLTGDRLND